MCKIIYTSSRREENGMGWATDWPFAGIHLMIRVSELTKTPVSRDERVSWDIYYWRRAGGRRNRGC